MWNFFQPEGGDPQTDKVQAQEVLQQTRRALVTNPAPSSSDQPHHSDDRISATEDASGDLLSEIVDCLEETVQDCNASIKAFRDEFSQRLNVIEA